jgi:hypothetical protein
MSEQEQFEVQTGSLHVATKATIAIHQKCVQPSKRQAVSVQEISGIGM